LWALPDGEPVHLDILKGNAPGTGLGGIELQGYRRGLLAADPPRDALFEGGACMVSYTSDDIEAAYEAIARDEGATVLSTPTAVEAPPYDSARAFCFLGPGGERFELCAVEQHDVTLVGLQIPDQCFAPHDVDRLDTELPGDADDEAAAARVRRALDQPLTYAERDDLRDQQVIFVTSR
jgi:hypothetical protein